MFSDNNIGPVPMLDRPTEPKFFNNPEDAVAKSTSCSHFRNRSGSDVEMRVRLPDFLLLG
jgi:hypothetical protein